MNSNIFNAFPWWAEVIGSLGSLALSSMAEILQIALTLGLFVYVVHRL